MAHAPIIRIAKLVANLYYGKETDESLSSKVLYGSLSENFPTIVVVRLLQVYRFTDLTPKIRSFSLTLIDSLLISLDYTCVEMKTETYDEIKILINSCLALQGISEHDFQLLSRFLAHVTFYFCIEFIPWDDLCSHIISLGSTRKALWMFNELPMVIDEKYLMPLLENGLQETIVKGLLNPESDEVLSLAIESGFNLIVQLVGKKKDHLFTDLVYATLKSVWEMINVRGKETVLRKAFVRVARKVGLEALRFREAEYETVSRLTLMLKETDGIGEATEMAAKKIHEVLDKYYKHKKVDLSSPNRLVIHGT